MEPRLIRRELEGFRSAAVSGNRLVNKAVYEFIPSDLVKLMETCFVDTMTGGNSIGVAVKKAEDMAMDRGYQFYLVDELYIPVHVKHKSLPHVSDGASVKGDEYSHFHLVNFYVRV